jgi:general secretion pathway protein A
MYTEYFKLNEPPFSLTPDPRFLFMSERHREGLAHLVYGVQQPGGFVQLTGEIGTGKTTLCRCLVKQLPPDTDIALILNPRLTETELIESVCDELRIPRPAESASIKGLIDALNQHLLQSHAQHRRTVLIVDEAQNLRIEVLEQIRLLTNLETSREKLLQIILIGQPELLTILKRPGLRQLAQRITARYHLQALSRRETYAYIKHRLSIAGTRDPLFTKRAMRQVYRLSGGMPRVINIICDRALLGAYALEKRVVSARIVRGAGRETQGIIPWYRKLRPAWTAGIILLAAAMAAAAFFFSPFNRSVFRRDAAAKPAVTAKTNALPAPSLPVPAAPPAETGKAASAAPVPETPAAVTAPMPKITSPAKQVPAGPKFAEVLADPVLRGGAISSFVNLYDRWGAGISMGPSDYGCRVGRAQGFECLFQAGSWSKLRRFDLPAILEVALPDGKSHRVTLVGLGEKTARLAIGNREYTFPFEEINEVWDGSFIIVWKPPFTLRRVAPGAQGEDVVWVRRALDKIEGKDPDPAPSDVYDDSLRQRVMGFQRERSLIEDGVVGSETLVRLALAVGQQKAPSISQYAP